MSKDIINFDAIRLTTELNKYQRHKEIPNSFLDGTFTILDVKEILPTLSRKHKIIANKLIKQYDVDIKQSKDGLIKVFLNEYRAFLNNQHTRNERWVFPNVMKKYRYNINPVRALTYDVREMAYSFNPDNDHHIWLQQLVTDPNFYHRIIQDIIKDRKKVDKIINYYVPLFNTANVNFEEPLEMKHLRTLRTDLLEYANLFTEFRKYYPE